MYKLFSGTMILAVGLLNLGRSRRQPPLINAKMLRNLGLVGIGVGLVLIVAGIEEMLRQAK